MIIKFRFLTGNRFELLLFVQSNIAGTNTESWTQFNGTVLFSKDVKGQQVFTTTAERGLYRVIKNGTIITRAIPENEIRTQHSNTYLWETTNFKDYHNNKYLLIVNIDEHPLADISHPETINPQWVSRFHARDDN